MMYEYDCTYLTAVLVDCGELLNVMLCLAAVHLLFVDAKTASKMGSFQKFLSYRRISFMAYFILLMFFRNILKKAMK